MNGTVSNLFAGIPKKQVVAIIRLSQTHDFAHGETVFRSSEPAHKFFLIKTGCVDYFVHTLEGRDVLFRRLAQEEILGFGTFFSEPAAYLGTAVAYRRTTALVWDRQSIRAIAQDHPRFVENALRVLFHYFAIYIARHVRLVSNNARERLALCLVNLGGRVGKRFPEGVEVEIDNERLASLADVTRCTASRTLKRWERAGVLTKSYGKVMLNSPEKLFTCRSLLAKSSIVR